MGQPYPADPNLRPTNIRFGVLGFTCSLALLTYLDRVCISRVSKDIQNDLGISSIQMGLVFGAFTLGYGLFEVPGGWMGDVWGARRVLTRIVLWWSVFTALTGCVWQFTLDSGYEVSLLGLTVPLMLNSLVVLLLVRFLFGCGEAGCFPNVARIFSLWFPVRERGAAQGALWMFARLGGAVAPVITGRLSAALGWRQAFWVLGLIGAVWCVLFYYWFRDRPEEKPSCNAAERDLIRGGALPPAQEHTAHPQAPWGRLVTSLSMWGLILTSAGVNFGAYFFPTWQPRYLEDVHKIPFDESEWLTGLPYFCGAFGALLGGALSDRLIRATGSRRWGRSLIALAGFGGAGVCILCMGLAAEAWQAVALLCLTFFINDLAVAPLWAASAEIGGRYAGTVSGVMNTAGCIGAFSGPLLTSVFLAAAPPGAAAGTPWLTIFPLYAAAWFVAALAWLVIDAGTPIVRDAGAATTT